MIGLRDLRALKKLDRDSLVYEVMRLERVIEELRKMIAWQAQPRS